MTEGNEASTEEGTAPPGRGWRRRWVGNVIGALVVLAITLGVLALGDLHDSRDYSAQGGRTDHVGGEFDDLFTVCRDPQGKIFKVYAYNGGEDEDVARCEAQGGKLYNDGWTKDSMSMMCVVGSQMAWWSDR
ncbi:hypothetical protein [Luteococcus sediminum]